MATRLLLVEDNQIDQMAFKRFVQREGLDYTYRIAGSVAEAREHIRAEVFDVIVLDYLLGDGTAFDLFDNAKGTPVVVVTGSEDAEIAVQSIQKGAYDYITKDADGDYLTTLPITVFKALSRKHAEEQIGLYREHLEELVKERTVELEAEIAERNRAEFALRQSEERYRRLVENAPLGIISIDAQGEIMDVNGMVAAMLGAPSVEALKAINVLTTPSFLNAGIANDFSECLETGLPSISERICFSEWDKQVFLRYHLTPLRDENFGISGVQAIVEDITERKLAEEALQESEAEYRSLFKNMLSGFGYHKIIKSEQGIPIDFVFLEVNDAFEHLTGLNRSVIGKRATEVWPVVKTLEPDLINVYGHVALTGKEITFDLHFPEFSTWYSVSAYSPEQGYFVALYENITERKRAEDSLRELNEVLEQRVATRTAELQETNRALQESLEVVRKTQEQLVQAEKMASLGGLVAGVAHEINTPVGVGVTAASYLHQRTLELKEIYEKGEMKRSDLMSYLKTAQESSEMILGNLQRAADQVKSFKQVAVDQTSDEKRIFRLNNYLNGVLLNLHPKLKRTRHHIEIHCPEDLELESYPGAFSQIFTNFIMNSLLHAFGQMETGEMTIDVIVLPEGKLCLHYRDNGRGMSEEERVKVFEPFFTTKRSQGGTGLGLHIVFNLVTQRLNGTIRCESEPNAGTSFIIEIPYAQKL